MPSHGKRAAASLIGVEHCLLGWRWWWLGSYLPARIDWDCSQGAVPSLVVDCIDDVDTKADLLQYCVEHGEAYVAAAAADCAVLRSQGDQLSRSRRQG